MKKMENKDQYKSYNSANYPKMPKAKDGNRLSMNSEKYAALANPKDRMIPMAGWDKKGC